jgi:hypothetical protein
MTTNAATALRALRRAAAHSDGGTDPHPLAEAVHVHAGHLEPDELQKLVLYLVGQLAAAFKSIDGLTGSLERVTGSSSWERINQAVAEEGEG